MAAAEVVRLTVRDVARMLNLSPQRVYALCAQGVLPHRRIGRAIWLMRPELEAWLRGGQEQGRRIVEGRELP